MSRCMLPRTLFQYVRASPDISGGNVRSIPASEARVPMCVSSGAGEAAAQMSADDRSADPSPYFLYGLQRMLRSSPYLPTRKQGRKSWANGPYYRPSRVLCLGVCSPHAGHCAVPQLVWDQSIGESSPGDTSLMLSVPRSRDSGSPDRKIRSVG